MDNFQGDYAKRRILRRELDFEGRFGISEETMQNAVFFAENSILKVVLEFPRRLCKTPYSSQRARF